MSIHKKIGEFVAENEEKIFIEFMTIAGLDEEYKSAKYIPQIKDVLEKFDELGYSITEKRLINIDPRIAWRITLLLDNNVVTRRDIEVRLIADE